MATAGVSDGAYQAVMRVLTQRSDELTAALNRIDAQREQVVTDIHDLTTTVRVLESLHDEHGDGNRWTDAPIGIGLE